MTVPRTRYDLDRPALAELLAGVPRFRADQVWHGLYADLLPIEDITPLPRSLRDELEQALPRALEPIVESTSDDGATTKALFGLPDGHRIETVLMHYDRRTTVCISTQVGCAMACSFCATGQAGFDRHLGAGEIVEQVVWAARRSRPERLSNVVFMGMGEPLANYEPTLAAINRCHDALGLSARHLTVSTVGLVPAIDRLASEGLPITLAVSLHAANDELRNRLVPINRRYPLDALMGACERWRSETGRRVSFEWAMIAGVNDRSDDAEGLARLARQARAHVNLIPLNPTDGYPTSGSEPTAVASFRDRLAAAGVTATVRRNRGVEIDAACGQLRQRAESGSVTIRPRR